MLCPELQRKSPEKSPAKLLPWAINRICAGKAPGTLSAFFRGLCKMQTLLSHANPSRRAKKSCEETHKQAGSRGKRIA